MYNNNEFFLGLAFQQLFVDGAAATITIGKRAAFDLLAVPFVPLKVGPTCTASNIQCAKDVSVVCVTRFA
jgi:hypothetical protein